MGKQKMAATAGNGNKQSKSSFLKLQHLQNVAVWSSGDTAVPPSLAAFFGRRFSACGEGVGVPPDDSLFTCERCETILQPGDNCTVRIEKNKARRKRKGSKVPTQNNVVYMCHFCSHRTVKRGTLKGHMKRICPPKDKPAPQPKVRILKPEKCSKESSSIPKTLENPVNETCRGGGGDASASVEVAVLENSVSESTPGTPAPVPAQVETRQSLLDTSKRKRNKPGSNINSSKTDVTSAISSSKKRKKKTWTSLKDMVKSSEKASSNNLPNITIPFFL